MAALGEYDCSVDAVHGTGCAWSGARNTDAERPVGTSRSRRPGRRRVGREAGLQDAGLSDTSAGGPGDSPAGRPLRPVQRRPPGAPRGMADAQGQSLLWRPVGPSSKRSAPPTLTGKAASPSPPSSRPSAASTRPSARSSTVSATPRGSSEGSAIHASSPISGSTKCCSSPETADGNLPTVAEVADGRMPTFQTVGRVKVSQHRPVVGRVKTLQVKREGRRWYVVVVTETETVPLPPTGRSVGVDVGVARFLTTSDGVIVANPRFLDAAQRRIADLQRRKERPSLVPATVSGSAGTRQGVAQGPQSTARLPPQDRPHPG